MTSSTNLCDALLPKASPQWMESYFASSGSEGKKTSGIASSAIPGPAAATTARYLLHSGIMLRQAQGSAHAGRWNSCTAWAYKLRAQPLHCIKLCWQQQQQKVATSTPFMMSGLVLLPSLKTTIYPCMHLPPIHVRPTDTDHWWRWWCWSSYSCHHSRSSLFHPVSHYALADNTYPPDQCQ